MTECCWNATRPNKVQAERAPLLSRLPEKNSPGGNRAGAEHGPAAIAGQRARPTVTRRQLTSRDDSVNSAGSPKVRHRGRPRAPRNPGARRGLCHRRTQGKTPPACCTIGHSFLGRAMRGSVGEQHAHRHPRGRTRLFGLICHSGIGTALTCREIRVPANRAAPWTLSRRVWRKRSSPAMETDMHVEGDPLHGLARRCRRTQPRLGVAIAFTSVSVPIQNYCLALRCRRIALNSVFCSSLSDV